jgi:foldase protein PrsA
MLSFLRKKMKSIMIAVAVLFAASMFYGLGYTGLKSMKNAPQKGSIATINGKEIDHARFQRTIKNMFEQEKGRIKPEQAILYQTMALQQVIDFELMLKEGKRYFKVSGAEMDQTIDQIMTANKIPNRDALKQALANMGQKFDEFKNSIKDEIILAKIVNKIKSQVSMTPEDIREVKASHILVMPRGTDAKADFEARVKIEGILQKIKKGESFADLAKKNSDDMGSASKGGELGYFTTGMMVPEFEKAVFALKPGQLSEIVKTSYGYHIIKMEATRLRTVKVKGKDISEVVLAEKQDQAFKRWLVGLRQKNKVEINEPIIKAHSYLLGGNLNEAISTYNEAAMGDPSNAYIHLFLADAYLKAGNKEFALLEYDKASQMSGADPSLLISIGDAYKTLKKTDLALAQYRKASLISGDNKDMHKELKDIFSKIGSQTDAAKETSEIKRLEKKEKFEKEIQDKMKL